MRGRLFSELFEPELSSLAMLNESMLAIFKEPAFSFTTAEEQSAFVAVVFGFEDTIVGDFFAVASADL